MVANCHNYIQSSSDSVSDSSELAKGDTFAACSKLPTRFLALATHLLASAEFLSVKASASRALKVSVRGDWF